MNYTVEDLKKYRDVILLRMKLEGLKTIGRKTLILLNKDVLESLVRYLDKTTYVYILPEEVNKLFKYYKSYLPNLTKSKMLTLLGYSPKQRYYTLYNRKKVYVRNECLNIFKKYNIDKK